MILAKIWTFTTLLEERERERERERYLNFFKERPMERPIILLETKLFRGRSRKVRGRSADAVYMFQTLFTWYALSVGGTLSDAIQHMLYIVFPLNVQSKIVAKEKNIYGEEVGFH